MKKQNMHILEWLDTISNPGIRKKAISNYINKPKEDIYHRDHFDMYDNLVEALEHAFEWSSTYEEGEYWGDISDSISHGNFDKEYPSTEKISFSGYKVGDRICIPKSPASWSSTFGKLCPLKEPIYPYHGTIEEINKTAFRCQGDYYGWTLAASITAGMEKVEPMNEPMNEKNIRMSDLLEGRIYYLNYAAGSTVSEFIIRYDSQSGAFIYPKRIYLAKYREKKEWEFVEHNGAFIYNSISTIRYATTDETEWLNACEKANKLVKKEYVDIYPTYPPEGKLNIPTDTFNWGDIKEIKLLDVFLPKKKEKTSKKENKIVNLLNINNFKI
jgi:hypothetical protein